jgi:hypothetical protein
MLLSLMDDLMILPWLDVSTYFYAFSHFDLYLLRHMTYPDANFAYLKARWTSWHIGCLFLGEAPNVQGKFIVFYDHIYGFRSLLKEVALLSSPLVDIYLGDSHFKEYLSIGIGQMALKEEHPSQRDDKWQIKHSSRECLAWNNLKGSCYHPYSVKRPFLREPLYQGPRSVYKSRKTFCLVDCLVKE